MAAATHIHFVRHGDVENPRRVFYGRLPGFPLSERGLRQARAAGAVLRDRSLAAIFSSPMLRTRQTAECIAAEHPELSIAISDLLNEVHTPLEGRTFKELTAGKRDAYQGTQPYEQPLGVLQRMHRFIGGVLGQYAGRHVVAVTHGDPIAFLMLWAKGLPLTTPQRLELYRGHLAKGSITTLSFRTTASQRPRVTYLEPPVADD